MNSAPYATIDAVQRTMASAIPAITTPTVEPGPELDRARALVLQHNRASLGLLQRYMGIGRDRANELLGQLQRDGVVSVATVNGVYQVGDPLRASWGSMVEWIVNADGQQIEVIQEGYHIGPVQEVADHHLVQKINRTQYVIHARADLDKMPAVNDPSVTIKYKDGIGYVTGGSGGGDAGQGQERDIFTHERKKALAR